MPARESPVERRSFSRIPINLPEPGRPLHTRPRYASLGGVTPLGPQQGLGRATRNGKVHDGPSFEIEHPITATLPHCPSAFSSICAYLAREIKNCTKNPVPESNTSPRGSGATTNRSSGIASSRAVHRKSKKFTKVPVPQTDATRRRGAKAPLALTPYNGISPHARD